MDQVRHRDRKQWGRTRVAGVRGDREYLVDDEGWLREIGPDKVPGERGVHSHDAAEYAQFSGSFEVASATGAAPEKPQAEGSGSAKPPPPPPPRRQRPNPPGGTPWGAKDGDADPGTYASRFPPADHPKGHNALTEADWRSLFETATGVPLAPKPEDVSKAAWVATIRESIADLDRALAVPAPPTT